MTKSPRRHTVAALAEILGLAGVELVAFTAAAQGRAVALSAPLTSAHQAASGDLVGRERHLGALADLVLGGRHRIVTVVGTAGVGKTRLVAELISTFLSGAPLSIYTLELATVTEPALLGELIAEVVGAGGRSKLAAQDRVAAELRDRRVLLVLDCVERVVAAAPLVAALVRRCSGLTVLATSQRPWRVSGERELHLPPLPAVAAAELFVRRAAAANPGWRVGGVDNEVVAEICHRLEGLPLAIELAAARMRVLSVRELASRLDRRLHVLSGGPVDLPDRHRSLRGAIESSLDLVTPGTRTVFGWLGAFPGGARLADLETVAAALNVDVDGCLPAVEELVQTSLVRVADEAGWYRYTLPDAVRELAVEDLAAAAQGGDVRRAAAARYLALVVAWCDDPAPGRALSGADADNLRAAVEIAVRDHPALLTPAVMDALYRHYDLTGRYSEGQAAFSWSGMGGAGLVRAGRLALLRCDTEAARQLGDQAVAQLAPDDHIGLAEARLLLGWVGLEVRDWRGARSHLRAALVQARRAGDLVLLGRVLNNLGVCSAFDGRLRDAERQTAAALVAKRRGGAGPIELARTLNNLAENARDAGSFGDAARRAEEATTLFAAAGHHRGAATAASTGALIWLAHGDTGAALAAIDRATLLLGDTGEDLSTVTVVDLRRTLVWHAAGRAGEAAELLRRTLPHAMRHERRTQEEAALMLAQHAALVAAGDPVLAATMVGAAGELLLLANRGIPPAEQKAIDVVTRIGVAALGKDAFAQASAAGAVAGPQTLAALCGRLATATPTNRQLTG
ncbi:ATP-binding protein [Phytohabitans flavus]|uniref:ATP-binding protein n=1 Tax=Phytohabitans flavus TaxID=1076124 RepID=UPI00156748A5|nr:NB-ARC domain-containing protein [Phytohabitans flavus]